MVVVKLCSYQRKRPPISVIAADLKMSPSEVHAGYQASPARPTFTPPQVQDKPNLSAIEEFLLHGVKYAFPAEHGQVTRGLPTSYAALPLKDEIAPVDELPPVWPSRDGETHGIALEPFYKTAPVAARRDPVLYELLALVDAVRDGRAREWKIAERQLINTLRVGNVKAQSRSLTVDSRKSSYILSSSVVKGSGLFGHDPIEETGATHL